MSCWLGVDAIILSKTVVVSAKSHFWSTCLMIGAEMPVIPTTNPSLILA